MKQHILVIGSNGQIGRELVEAAKCLGDVVAISRNSSPFKIELTQPETIRKVIQKINPTIIINAAAYTSVDDAEREAKLAMQINAEALGIIANEAKLIDATLIHYSTDYVFDGTKTTPYVENDVTNPISVYGKSKLAGEYLVLASECKFLIFRTSWVYASHGNNFVKSIIRLANERDQLNIVDDQIGCPNSADFIATATVKVLEKYIDAHGSQADKYHGIYHLSTSNVMSWYEFSKNIINIGYEKRRCKNINVNPIPSSEYPTIAARPKYSVLSNKNLFEKFQVEEHPWKFYLEKCIDAL
jgi:dTDP-4-dehydrorhamnose reductase